VNDARDNDDADFDDVEGARGACWAWRVAAFPGEPMGQ
jgi:hypothetical protein